MAVAALGTIIEWYDFGLYLYLAPIYARIFFPGSDQTENLIATFGIFAVAYLARPLGAIVFGRYGDRHGRRNTLLISAAIIAVALAGNAAIPTEAAIGIAAPLLLLLTRLVSGFAIGAEYSGILSYLLETAGKDRRGMITSLAPAMTGVGTLLAVGIAAALSGALDAQQLDSWGWRIPVAFGAVLAASLLLLRRGLGETPEFARLREAGEIVESPIREALAVARGPLVFAFVVSAVGSVGYYLNISYIPTYLNSVAGVSHTDALTWGTIAGVVVILVSVPAGWASDLIGRRSALLAVSAAFIVTTVPLFALIATGGDAAGPLGVVLLAIPAASFSAVSASAIPEQLPSRVRFTGLALGYNTAVAIFGGMTPLVATLLFQWTGSDVAPAFLVVVAAAVGLSVLWRMRETAKVKLTDLN